MSWLFNPAHRDAFHDKLWKRTDLAGWDERWAGLSVDARRHFVEDIKAAVRPGSQAPTTPAGRFSQQVLDELRGAGLISVQSAGSGQPRVTVPDAARGFATRLRTLKRYHLLDASRPSELVGYTDYCFASYDLGLALAQIVERVTGTSAWGLVGHPVEMFVSRRRWPGWIGDFLKDAVARAVLETVDAAGGVLPLAALAARLPDRRPEAVRTAVDALVNHLALVEDLDPATYEILVGVLPAVRADRARSAASRPPLEPVGTPGEVAPEGGIFVPDLRAVLLELAGGRARVRQDHRLYQKDHDRFLAVFDTLPRWLADDVEARQRQAWHVARLLSLVREVKASAGAVQLELSPAGQRWLASPVEEQYMPLFAGLRAGDADEYRRLDDGAFLGSEITAVPAKKGRRDDWSWALGQADREPLRAALYRALGPLPVGVFYRVRDVMDHFAHGEHNPLYLGGDRSAVVVRFAGQRIPPLEEHLEDLGKELLRELLGRLVEFGAVQAGLGADGHLLIARRPRLDAYFGVKSTTAAAPVEAPRVVVQPDFSVIVIGLNPAPAAELAPFCDRERQPGSPGALTFRLSRESVMRGLVAGLTGAQIVARLEGHSSNPVPQNVLTQVRSWCDWVRTVTASTAVLLRCPDAETADRVLGVLGKGAERVAETVVALQGDAVTQAIKKKLQEQGVLLGRG